MRRSKLTAVFAVLLALTVFFGGMWAQRLWAGTGAKTASVSAAQKSPTKPEAIGVQGKVAIQVFNAAGRQVAQWKGHNSLERGARNRLAACLSGLGVSPLGEPSCSASWVTLIEMCSGSYCSDRAPATNSMVPARCNVADPLNLCNGWASTATIDNPTPQTYTSAFGFAFSDDFDTIQISPPLALNAGDRAVVTITFTIS